MWIILLPFFIVIILALCLNGAFGVFFQVIAALLLFGLVVLFLVALYKELTKSFSNTKKYKHQSTYRNSSDKIKKQSAPKKERSTNLFCEKNADEDDSDYSWETHCEYCGELLEDCVCDHRHESHEDISLSECDCDEDW